MMSPPLSYPNALLATLAILAASGAALHRCSHRPPGHPATAAVVALLSATNFLLPLLLFDQRTAYSTRGMLGFTVTWLASAKAVALLCGRGQLAARRWSLLQFIALYAMPLVPALGDPAADSRARIKSGAGTAPGPDSSDGGGGSFLRRTAVNAALTAVCLGAAVVLQPRMIVKEVLLTLAMYGWLGFQLDVVAAVARPWLGLRLEPLFRPPWTEAYSIAAFWGRCWNLAASNAVRIAVYEPLCEGAWVHRRGAAGAGPAARSKGRGGTGRGALAVCAACASSGAVHEWLVYVIAGETTRGAWLLFFCLQGPLMLVERRLLGLLGRAGIKPPHALRTAATLCTLLGLAHHLFFGPVERMATMAHFVAEWRTWFAGPPAAHPMPGPSH